MLPSFVGAAQARFYYSNFRERKNLQFNGARAGPDGCLSMSSKRKDRVAANSAYYEKRIKFDEPTDENAPPPRGLFTTFNLKILREGIIDEDPAEWLEGLEDDDDGDGTDDDGALDSAAAGGNGTASAGNSSNSGKPKDKRKKDKDAKKRDKSDKSEVASGNATTAASARPTIGLRPGEGLAFVVIAADSPRRTGAPGSGLGFTDLGEGFAVEFDLVSNPERDDPPAPHVAVHWGAGEGFQLSSTHDITSMAAPANLAIHRIPVAEFARMRRRLAREAMDSADEGTAKAAAAAVAAADSAAQAAVTAVAAAVTAATEKKNRKGTGTGTASANASSAGDEGSSAPADAADAAATSPAAGPSLLALNGSAGAASSAPPTAAEAAAAAAATVAAASLTVMPDLVIPANATATAISKSLPRLSPRARSRVVDSFASRTGAQAASGSATPVNVVQIDYHEGVVSVFLNDLTTPLLQARVLALRGEYLVGFTAATDARSADHMRLCDWYFERTQQPVPAAVTAAAANGITFYSQVRHQQKQKQKQKQTRDHCWLQFCYFLVYRLVLSHFAFLFFS